MSKILYSILIFIALFLAGRNFGLFEPAPCTKPITYSLGSLDSRFGVSKADFLKAISEAEAVWEKPIGLNLFSSSTEGKLSINLVYDYRQETTQELSVIEGEVKESEGDYKALEASYAEMKSQYNTLKSTYDVEVVSFNQHKASYEQAVDEWNSGPRTSRKEFEALESKRLVLEAEASELKTTENKLNSSVHEINALVTRLNTLAKQLNLNVKDYNTIGAARGETFTGGTYTSDRTGERIDIFEFQNHDKLVRVLAHELGHALGLEHIDDPKAIMYKFNEGEVGKLAPSDLTALKTLCAIN